MHHRRITFPQKSNKHKIIPKTAELEVSSTLNVKIQALVLDIYIYMVRMVKNAELQCRLLEDLYPI